ncbi:39S ribosomal protein L52, mitochondrial isoform X2 [Cimex lectularius]|uniref:Large ribosomal subunit protein mL52 n=1 Tax=Cimex lectularius TaxID=79782 RepID=A0A8I6TBW8_CIMLE|nr:39S ribosomal protein L52, mitochondrial isoform X2 [Cimex lectularius]
MYTRLQKLISPAVLCGQRRLIYLSPITQSIDNVDWRLKKGLPDNPNRMAILRDGPDYTFLDGKPTPYGTGQKLRIMKQREYTK